MPKKTDQTMVTEMEYLKFLQDNKVADETQEVSFFKSIIGVEKSGGVATTDEKAEEI